VEAPAGSLPRWIESVKRRWKSAMGPSSPGHAKSITAAYSSRLFWMGVPVSSTRFGQSTRQQGHCEQARCRVRSTATLECNAYTYVRMRRRICNVGRVYSETPVDAHNPNTRRWRRMFNVTRVLALINRPTRRSAARVWEPCCAFRRRCASSHTKSSGFAFAAMGARRRRVS